MRAKIVTSIRNILKPGFYAISSDNPDYYLVKSLLLKGTINYGKSRLRKIGETAMPYGMKGVYFQVLGNSDKINAVRNPGPDEREAIGTTEMRMGDEDYSSVKNEYQSWRVKWWREVIQNAVDAGAQNVKLSSVRQADGTYLVSCEDDGVGMDQPTFTDVFLVLKASTKRDDKGRNLGGFGEAKKLIVLPWIAWRISSRDRLYEGVGRSAKIYEAPMRRGTKVEAVMGAGYNEHTEAEDAIRVLSKSYYPYVNFTVNGKPTEAYFRPTQEVFRVGDKAVAYFVPGEAESYYHVTARDSRNHGVLYMFSKWLESKSLGGTIIVELTGPSKDILTANRDGFRDTDIERELNKFINKAIVDTTSAFKSKNKLIEKVYEGTGKFKVKGTESEILNLAARQDPLKRKGTNRGNPSEVYEVDTNFVNNLVNTLNSITQGESGEIGVVSPDSVRDYLDTRMTGTDQFENAVRLISWRPDFFVINEIPGFAIPSAFDPITMKPRVRKIAKVWAELVRYALIQLDYSGEYGVGWIFSRKDENTWSSRTAAAYKQLQGQHWILLNPFTDDSHDEMFQASRMDHLETLYAYAIHECTHMVDDLDQHEERFASALTRNMAKCAKGFRKLHSIVSSIRMKGDVDL